MFKSLKTIRNKNGIVSTILLYNLYLEKKYNLIFCKLLRKLFLQPILNVQIIPSSFSISSIISLKLPHPFMIIIHGASRIGDNCIIYHEVTIGCIDHKSQMAPIINDNVYIGCKSVLLGGINIGNNSRIGAGSIVLKNTPPIHML